jgi:CubicO group peptidase (beta-lactamase class C family)
MRVCVDSGKCASMAAQNNEFGWDGWLGPFMAIDLENKLAFVYFQQMTDTGFSYVSRRCKNIIYSSLLN